MVAKSNDIEAIYNAALEKASETERSAYLDAVCGRDPVVRARVEALLKAHNEAGDFLEVPVFDVEVTLDDSPLTEGPGTVIGRYKLLEKIGEGGMASVYMAEQEKPVHRKVALKIIKLGMDTKQVIARFEAERQALAMMDHSNIARVLDAGATETGRSYFVMELVKGVSVTEYCDKNRLSTRERLDLFIFVCNAVQHAHQKGIIHRDIKPTNVMVTLHDGTPVPKVIDFGIAKAINQRLTERTLFTRYAEMIGTPEYMSPEQAELSGLDVDTRTDIYSLGVLLYELLTGTTPFGGDELRSAGYLELQRIIREEEPDKPSTRLSTLGEMLTDVAEHRQSNPDLLPKLVSGDLDWIVMKSLEKDRTRRYATATELAADVERHLNSEPVQAAAPSVSYRLRKFVRRNRVSVIAGSLVAAALLIGAIAATIGFVQAKSQRNRAEANLSLALQALDEIYLGVAKERLLEKAEIEEADRELLQKALIFYKRFAEQNKDTPKARYQVARAYRRVGDIQGNLGQYGKAEEAYRQSIALFEQLAAEFPNDPEYRHELAETLVRLGPILHTTGTSPQAEAALRQAVDLCTKLKSEFPNQPQYRHTLSNSYFILGALLGLEGEEALRRSIEHSEDLAAEFPKKPGYRDTLASGLTNIALLLKETSRLEEAELKFRQAVVLLEKLAEELPDVREHKGNLAKVYCNLSTLLHDTGRLEEAEQACRRTIEFCGKLTDEFPNIPEYRALLALALNNLGAVFYGVGQLKESENQYSKAVKLHQKLAAEFPDVPKYRYDLAMTCRNLGTHLYQMGDHSQAENLFRQAGALCEELVKQFSRRPEYLAELTKVNCMLGIVLDNTSRREEAHHEYQQAIDGLEKLAAQFPNVPEYRYSLAVVRCNLGVMYTRTNRFEESQAELVQAIVLSEKLAAEFPDVPKYQSHLAENHHNLGGLLSKRGSLEEAEQAYWHAIELNEQLVANFPEVPKWRLNLANCYKGLARAQKGTGRLDEAEEAYGKALEIIEELVAEGLGDADDHLSLVKGHAELGGMLNEMGRYKEAEERYRRAVAVAEKFAEEFPGVPSAALGLSVALNNLGVMLHKTGRLEEAGHYYLRALEVIQKVITTFPEASGYRKRLALYTENLNNLAWCLVTSPDVKLRDPASAVELARKAVQAAPEKATFWNTLGVAHYRAGQWEDTITALRKSRELGAGGHEGIDLFFIAMAHWQLGKKDEARQWYDRGVEWMEQKQAGTNEEDNRRFRAEAAEVLGISEQPNGKEVEK